MKKTFLKNSIGSRLAALVATGLLTGFSASADFTLLYQNYFGGDTSYSASSVVAGAGTNASSALEMTNSAAALGNGYGYAAMTYQETGLTANTNSDIAAYTLHFDAKCSVAGSRVEIRCIDSANGTLDTAPTPPGYGNDVNLNTTYTHYDMPLNNTTMWRGQNNQGPFNPSSSTWNILFQNNSGAGGNPAAWRMDIDNISVTVVGTVPPPPPITIYPPVKVPEGLNLYAGTAVNAFFDRNEVMSVLT
jgi:hypothetical protein